jgi:hypothetical protein
VISPPGKSCRKYFSPEAKNFAAIFCTAEITQKRYYAVGKGTLIPRMPWPVIFFCADFLAAKIIQKDSIDTL